MTEPSAKIIADSISPAGHRVTTMEIVMHRFVLAEFNTHRVFSRNSESSRAVPFLKKAHRVKTDPAMPVIWASEQKGMQGGDVVDNPEQCSYEWGKHMLHSVEAAERLQDEDVHKSIINRLLEPFMWHTTVITATAWQNFFLQRCSPLAQPEIRVAAEAMKAAYDASTPTEIEAGNWHLPYIEDEDVSAVQRMLEETGAFDVLAGHMRIPLIRTYCSRVAAARCARVSYLTQSGKRDILEDLELYERLVSASPMHASPLEHIATPADLNQHFVALPPAPHVADSTAVFDTSRILVLPRYGNLLGWHQLRFDVEAAQQYQAFS